MRRLLYNSLAVIFCLAASSPAMAQDALTPVNFRGQFVFTFSGIEFGRLGLHVAEDSKNYDITADIKTTGLLAIFVKHSSHTTITSKNGDFTYESNYHTRKKKRYVKMVGKNGVFTEETLVPTDIPEKRPPVPADVKKGAYDPLSFVLAMRRGAFAAANSADKTYSLKFYDGRRLTEGFFTLEPSKTGADKRAVAAFSAYRKQLAGFTPSELDDLSQKEPPLYIYYDERFVPIRMEARMMLGTIAATLTKECGPEENCLLGNSD